MTTQNIFSHGKLLLTGEYAVLDGAIALAVPTKSGQDLRTQIIQDEKSLVFWKAYHQEKLWLDIKIDYINWKILQSNDSQSAEFLVNILQEMQEKSEIVFQSSDTYIITTNLQFPPNFGWGSSSTFINNLAEFAKIDAFQLNETFFKGSGYDVAVAKEGSAILYQNKPERLVKPIHFKPVFLDELILVYLNQKKNSREAISQYRSREKSQNLIDELSEITLKTVEVQNLASFSDLMNQHEHLVSHFLKISTIKEKLFSDYGGFVKSLGGWEGDFVLASKFGDYKTYFKHKNFDTVLDYIDVII